MTFKREEELLNMSMEETIKYLENFIDALSDEEFKEHLEHWGFEIIHDVEGKLFTELFNNYCKAI